MKYDSEQIGRKIREERKKAALTQDELGKLLFISGKQVSNYEKGKPLPSLETLLMMSELFHCELGYLLGEQSYKDRSKLNTAICESLGISSRAVESLRAATRKGLTQELVERQEIISRFFESPFLGEFFDCLFDAVSISKRLDRSGSDAYDSLSGRYGNEITESAVKALLCGPIDTTNSAENQDRTELQEAVKELNASIDRSRDDEYALKVAKYELRETFETLIRSLLR